MVVYLSFSLQDCAECACAEEESCCLECCSDEGKCHHIFPCLTETLSLVAFLVEDACVGDFMSLCLSG
jgi:hypothetical protein